MPRLKFYKIDTEIWKHFVLCYMRHAKAFKQGHISQKNTIWAKFGAIPTSLKMLLTNFIHACFLYYTKLSNTVIYCFWWLSCAFYESRVIHCKSLQHNISKLTDPAINNSLELKQMQWTVEIGGTEDNMVCVLINRQGVLMVLWNLFMHTFPIEQTQEKKAGSQNWPLSPKLFIRTPASSKITVDSCLAGRGKQWKD